MFWGDISIHLGWTSFRCFIGYMTLPLYTIYRLKYKTFSFCVVGFSYFYLFLYLFLSLHPIDELTHSSNVPLQQIVLPCLFCYSPWSLLLTNWVKHFWSDVECGCHSSIIPHKIHHTMCPFFHGKSRIYMIICVYWRWKMKAIYIVFSSNPHE